MRSILILLLLTFSSISFSQHEVIINLPDSDNGDGTITTFINGAAYLVCVGENSPQPTLSREKNRDESWSNYETYLSDSSCESNNIFNLQEINNGSTVQDLKSYNRASVLSFLHRYRKEFFCEAHYQNILRSFHSSLNFSPAMEHLLTYIEKIESGQLGETCSVKTSQIDQKLWDDINKETNPFHQPIPTEIIHQSHGG